MDAWETQRTALSETVDQLRAALENQPDSRILVQELGQELRQKIQDHQDAWEAGHQELRTALEALESQQVDRQELVRDIREDLQQRVQEGMDAWEAQRTALDQEIGNLKQTLSDGDARIETLGASVVTRKDLEAIQEKLQAEIAREIPAAAARIIREEIAALTR
jgi:gas vesicle protein